MLTWAMAAEKLPPPMPASAAHATYAHIGCPGLASNTMVPAVGISNTSEENTNQFRPPNLSTATAYGIRRQPPTSVAVAPSSSLSAGDSPYTARGMNNTITDQIDHTE